METIVKNIVDKYKEQKFDKSKILKELFDNDFLKKTVPSEIRRNTVIGILAQEIFKELGNKDTCEIRAIGDIKYNGVLKEKWVKLINSSLKNIKAEDVEQYDLTGVGSENLHEKLLEYMNLYYDLGDLKEKIKYEIIPAYGASDGFNMLLDTLNQIYNGKNIDFIFPEASFSVNIEVAKTFGFKTISLNKASKNDFFISKKQIDDLYKNNNNKQKVYYFTSIGNPSGEKINENNFFEIMNHIYSLDNNAIFILDNVYLGLLIQEDSTKMFQKIFKKQNLLKRIIFCESLSKTLGTTGIRIAWSWTLNKKLSSKLKRTSTLKKAGYSKVLDNLACNLLSDLKKITNFGEEIYNKISENRIDFYNNMKENFQEYFDFEKSPLVKERQGIYVLLKVKKGNKIEDIFAETGIIGVSMKFSDGKYIRYSFGKV